MYESIKLQGCLSICRDSMFTFINCVGTIKDYRDCWNLTECILSYEMSRIIEENGRISCESDMLDCTFDTEMTCDTLYWQDQESTESSLWVCPKRITLTTLVKIQRPTLIN